MFYFQTLLSQGLSGIDGTSIIPTVATIAYTILLIGFMISLYQAAMRGGDVQSLGVAAIKFLIVAIIVANWKTIFQEVNNSSNQIAQFIANSSSSGDMFSSWLTQLKQQFQTNTFSSFWKLIIGSPAALITVLLIVVAYMIFAVAFIVFAFFYTLYGCVLYVVGPLVLALLPMGGAGKLGSNFATNFFIWNSWGILYAIFGALITAIHVNDVNTIFNSGFGGFFVGTIDSMILGIVSIFYAVALILIPKIAKSIVAGDVGVTMDAMVRAGAYAAKTGMAVIAGAAAGGSAAAAGSSAGGASAGAGGGTGASAGPGSGAASASSSPPPTPSLANTIRSGIGSAMDTSSSPPSSRASNNGSNGSKPANAVRSAEQEQANTFRSGSVVQTFAFHAARVTAQMLRNQSTKNAGKEEEQETETANT